MRWEGREARGSDGGSGPRESAADARQRKHEQRIDHVVGDVAQVKCEWLAAAEREVDLVGERNKRADFVWHVAVDARVPRAGEERDEVERRLVVEGPDQSEVVAEEVAA